MLWILSAQGPAGRCRVIRDKFIGHNLAPVPDRALYLLISSQDMSKPLPNLLPQAEATITAVKLS